jgi:hypothetical protein
MPRVIRNDFFLADNSGIPVSTFVAIFRTNLTFLPCYRVEIRKMGHSS